MSDVMQLQLFETKLTFNEAQELMRGFLKDHLGGIALADLSEADDTSFDYTMMMIHPGIALESLVQARLVLLGVEDDAMLDLVESNLDGYEWLQLHQERTGIESDLDKHFGSVTHIEQDSLDLLFDMAKAGSKLYVNDLLLLGRLAEINAVEEAIK